MATKLQRLAINGLMWRAAHDNIGVYPAAVHGGPKPYEKRTAYMEGWNDCGSKYTEYFSSCLNWYETLPLAAEDKALLTELLINEEIRLHMDNGSCTMWVDCSDTFIWGCADGEDITLEELPGLQACLALSPTHGGELWCCRKRGMRPQTACYERRYKMCDWHLFDACGPERDDPDGRGRSRLG